VVPHRKDFVILACTILMGLQSVTNTHTETDRQTDAKAAAKTPNLRYIKMLHKQHATWLNHYDKAAASLGKSVVLIWQQTIRPMPYRYFDIPVLQCRCINNTHRMTRP